MLRRSVQWEAAVAAAALLAIGALRCSLAFLGGALPANGGVATSRLRGHGAAAASASKPAAAGTATSGPLVGSIAVAASLAAAALRRRQHACTALRATRTEWYRKVQRLGGDKAVFDVTIPKPLGVKMQKFPQRKGVGIIEIVPGGNTDELNFQVCVDDGPGMWVLEGDRVMAVNGTICEEDEIDGIVKLVGESEGDEITLTLMRNTRKGPIKVVLKPENQVVTVRRNSRLSAAAEYCAGKELTYGCIDGWCGTCWHRERSTNGIFKPCCDVLTADWDNVMPLVLTPKPEKAGDSTFLQPRGV
mmetsp:Transcript_127947/g.272854  ORF Transcript_127947/g.272854 Transcript_127947/m.272854 type:complete len:303 (-) Transcript_127947:186-1094(-)